MNTAIWQIRLARFSRRLHKWVGFTLALAMTVLSVTGAFVAWKKQVEYLQPATRISQSAGPGTDQVSGQPDSLNTLLPPARIARRVLELNLPQAQDLSQIDRIELRPAKGIYKVRLEPRNAWRSPLELQFDARSGALLNQGVRGDQLWMDLHSFAVFGELTKLIIMSLAGLSLLWLSLSGLYLFFFPRWFRAKKRRKLEQAEQNQ